MAQKKLIRFIFISFFFSAGLHAISFVEKRRKGPSISKVKEACCEQFGDVVKEIAPTLQSIGELQTAALNAIQGYYESESSSFCERASKETVLQCSQKLQSITQELKSVQQECTECMKLLR